MSPNGDKIVIETSVKSSDSEGWIWNIAFQYLHFLPKESSRITSWSVLDHNGHRKVIGTLRHTSYVKLFSDFVAKEGTCVGGVKWTPDGKNLSFIYQGKLYLLPVN